MTALSSIKMSAKQFLQLGEDPDGIHLDLIDGEIHVSPRPVPNHGYICGMLMRILLNHVVPAKLGQVFPDTDVVFDESNTRQPDICYYSTPRLHLVKESHLVSPPDLCIEILSPGTEVVDREEKFRLYEAHRVQHYWIIDPRKKTVEAYSLNSGVYALTRSGRNTEVVCLAPLPAMQIDLAELWPA